MHPEYAFVFTVEHNAITHWSYSPEAAKAAQSNMLEIVCAHAKKNDLARGLEIVIQDESCPVTSQTMGASSAYIQ
jgi:hypothetical protein